MVAAVAAVAAGTCVPGQRRVFQARPRLGCTRRFQSFSAALPDLTLTKSLTRPLQGPGLLSAHFLAPIGPLKAVWLTPVWSTGYKGYLGLGG